MSENITVGILGAGRIGQVHLKAMFGVSGLSVKTISDPFMSEELSALVQSMGAKNTSKEASAVLDDEEIDAVFICSPTDTHSDFSIQAIEKGKHVFCEKPIDMDLARIVEVKKKLQEAQDKNLVYQVGFNRRFDHNFLAIKNAVKNGAIGKSQMMRITSRDPSPPPIDYIKNSGGLFMDMMIHDFDMARFQADSEVVEVYTMAAVLVDEEIGKAGDVDSAIVCMKFENGMIGYIENSRQAVYGYDQRIEILGSEGAVHSGNDTESSIVICNNKHIASEKPLHFFLERYKDAYIKEQGEFFDAIRNKKPAPCGVEDGLESVRIAYAAKKSFLEHRPVSLEEIKGE